jgi:predicted metal-dependent hydrolase
MSLFAPQRFVHGERLSIAGAEVRLRVDARARRVSLRLDAARREFVATAPTLRRLNEAVAFAHQRADWIAGLVSELPGPSPIAPGATLELLGRPYRLEIGGGRARLEDDRLIAPAGERFAAGVLRVVKAEASRFLTERTAVHAAALGQPLPVVSVADARSRWGSCRQPRKRSLSAAVEVGRIRYSWRLVLAPYEVADYVAAHECAHLIEANHGPKFWALVGDLVGDERPHRAWLRANANRLHAFGRG